MENNKNTVPLQDRLRVEGVNCKGFGILSKFVMLDIDLNITAKTIYAYLCSLAGNDTTAFPRRRTIMNHLKLSKETFYNGFDLLKLHGYLRADRSNIFPFGNTYTIVSNPKKLETAQNSEGKSTSSYIKHTGLKSKGFGIVPRAVMLDTRISWKSKAIYAYFCSFAGTGNTAFPSTETILYQLNIGINSYYKHFRQLVALNYISVQQRKQDGRFSVNDYILNDLPDEQVGAAEAKKRKENNKPKSPTIHFKDNGEKSEFSEVAPSIDEQNENMPSIHFKDNGEKSESSEVAPSVDEQNENVPSIHFKDNVKQHHENHDNININNTTKNKKTKNNPSFASSRIDVMEKKVRAEKITKERYTYEQVIKENIDYDILISKNDFKIDTYLHVLVETMLDAVTSTSPILRINGSDLPQDIVKSRLLKLDEGHIEFVCLGLHQSKTKIKNLKNYVLTALYNSFVNMGVFYTQWVKSDIKL